jgi:DNA-binding CsgD family transcriptional regulator
VQWMPDLIETQVYAGRTAEAERTLAGFERTATRTGRRWALSTARRCRGMLVSSAHVDVVFTDAERLARSVPSPFERGRLELCWGERLRRDGRRIDARRHLGAALEQFESLGAKPWADRAAREIRASGARARRGPQARSRELTPQETNVALLVAEGLTNKDVAARLFLSPKTVEFHLGNVFHKLNVRTRTQLARVLREGSTVNAPH